MLSLSAAMFSFSTRANLLFDLDFPLSYAFNLDVPQDESFIASPHHIPHQYASVIFGGL
jgi:hypothetical protein